MSDEQGRDLVLERADRYAHAVYAVSKKLPKSELFGLTSQLRRAALSVPLNITEGYARQSTAYQKNFLMIAYGSLKESQYLLTFSVEESYVTPEDIKDAFELGDGLGGMLWKKTQTLKRKAKSNER